METPSPHSSPSASRSPTERARALALAVALAAAGPVLLAACGDDGGGDGDGDGDGADAAGAECGPGDAPADGVTLGAGEQAAVSFGDFRSSANNDCPPPEGGGPTSLTIQAAQTEPADPSRFLVLCLPRPDRIEQEPIPVDDDELVQLVDVLAETADGCGIAIDRDRAPSGQVTFSGFCDDGTHADGYALSFAATVPLLRTCGDQPAESIDGELGGSAAVVSGSL